MRSSVLREVVRAAAQDEQSAHDMVERALLRAQGPLVEDIPDDPGRVLVTFVVLDRIEQPFISCQLFADDSGESDEHAMAPLPGVTSAWWAQTLADSDVSTVYQFRTRRIDSPALGIQPDLRALTAYVHEVAEVSFADPFNPLGIFPMAALLSGGSDGPRPAPTRWESVLRLPQATADPLPSTKTIPGDVRHHRIHSSVLGNDRTVTLWSPRPQQTDPLPLVVLLDGEGFLLGMEAPRLFDALVGSGRVRPFNAALVHNPTPMARVDEYPCNDDLPDFLADELLPRLRSETAIAQTIVGGYSLGGLAACWTGYRRPDAFGGVLALSPSLWWGPPDEPEWLTAQYRQADRRPVRFWIDVGRLEVERMSGGDHLTMISSARRLRDVLTDKGYDVAGYRERAGGHDLVTWRQALTDGLATLIRPTA